MTNSQRTARACESRKAKIIFDSPRYRIEEIPLNLRIWIKLPKKPGFKSIDRDLYTPIELGIEFAKELAEDNIKNYFID